MKLNNTLIVIDFIDYFFLFKVKHPLKLEAVIVHTLKLQLMLAMSNFVNKHRYFDISMQELPLFQCLI